MILHAPMQSTLRIECCHVVDDSDAACDNPDPIDIGVLSGSMIAIFLPNKALIYLTADEWNRIDTHVRTHLPTDLRTPEA